MTTSITFTKPIKGQIISNLSSAMKASDAVKHHTTIVCDLLKSRGVDSTMLTGKQPEATQHIPGIIKGLVAAALDTREPGVLALLTMETEAAKGKEVGGHDRRYWQQQVGSYVGKIKRELGSRRKVRVSEGEGEGEGESGTPRPGETDVVRCIKELTSCSKRLKKMNKENRRPEYTASLNLLTDVIKTLQQS